MKHFVKDDQMNMFRLRTFAPNSVHQRHTDKLQAISWQFLANNKLGADLDANNLRKYDQVMQACLSTGAYCMIDIHNFARWNGGIIGQGGPTDEQFVRLWTQLATKYADNSKVVFELMNEPHDLDVTLWAQTCQKVVTAIRNAGATRQMILLPGTNFDSAATLVSSGSADALMAIMNPDGGTDSLLLDIHKYLDVDNSGTHADCVTDNTAAFETVAEYLRQKGRKGIVSETGASSDTSCMTAFCAQNALINANSDVFIGLVAWAAGSFSSSYLLSLTPSKQGNTLVDNALAGQCVVRTWLDANETVAPPPSTSETLTLVISTRVESSTKATSATTTQRTVAKTGSSVMVVTLTGTASLGVPTTLMTAAGSPSVDTSPFDGGSTSIPDDPSLTGGSASSPSQPDRSWAYTHKIPKMTVFLCLLASVLQ
jgi:endoglucanase